MTASPGRVKGMERSISMSLRDVIQEALSALGVHHDDLEFMSQAIERRILEAYILTPKGNLHLSERLDRLQEAILKGEEPERDVAAALDEAGETRYLEGLTFEEFECLERLRRKAAYLEELLHRQRYKRTIIHLQEELQRLSSPEGWNVYLKIEEEVNTEMLRLREGAPALG